MVEVLVLSVCIKGSPTACENSTVAYYKQSGIEQHVSEFEKTQKLKYPILYPLIPIVGLAAQGTYIVNIGNGRSLTLDSKQSIIGFKGEF